MMIAFLLNHVIIVNIISTIVIVDTMRTVKHKIRPLLPEQEIQFLALARAYQFEKNYFSDQLLNLRNRSHEASASPINIDSSYNQIRDKLVKNNYQSRNHLPARIWKMALKEAYDLHIRTYEAQIAFLKRDLNNRIYKFSYATTLAYSYSHASEAADKLATLDEVEKPDVDTTLNTFKEFLYFATNSLFYNYKTFRKFEEEFYSKKFRKARIYQRIQPILQKILKKAIEKEIFKLNSDKEADNNEPSKAEAQLQLRLQENIKTIEQFLKAKLKLHSCSFSESVSLACLQQLLHYYCNCLVKAIVKFRNYKPIQSKINPTITLDGDCYDLYSVYDEANKKNQWFLNIMSMESGKRIKGLELTGFHHAKKIMKHKKSPNLTLSFDRTDMTYYAHFTFKNKAKPKKTKSAKAKKRSGEAKSINNTEKCNCNYKYRYIQQKSIYVETKTSVTVADVLMTILTVGGDFGLTENYTFSDGWVSGRKQGKILNHITNKTKNSVAGLQRISEKGFFGVEKNNKTGKRNHKNNCFTHNQLLDNINKNYRKKQRKYNRFLQNYKYLLVNEIIDHFTSDSVYGQYSSANATHESHATVKLVFESLEYTSLGFDKKQKRQINLIKGILNVLEEKIERYNLPIEIEYVNPAYTSQNCPNCYWVARANRNKAECSFRCQHCGFTAIDDERFKGLTKVIPRSDLPSEDDFIAACNIAERISTVPDSTRLRLRDVKDRLMLLHEQVKVRSSCKMFDSSNIKCC